VSLANKPVIDKWQKVLDTYKNRLKFCDLNTAVGRFDQGMLECRIELWEHKIKRGVMEVDEVAKLKDTIKKNRKRIRLLRKSNLTKIDVKKLQLQELKDIHRLGTLITEQGETA
jgi:hypothetical protein